MLLFYCFKNFILNPRKSGGGGKNMNAKYSIVIPAYNEQESIPLFIEAVTPIMQNLNEEYEVIFVNDGSRDNTLNVLKNFANKDRHIKYVSFARNFGQQAAIFCGLAHSSGDAVIIMDVDLQDPVEVIPLMIEKWKDGYEIVHGKRTKRNGENFFKKFTSAMYLKFLQSISGLKIPKNVGEFKLLDRKVVDVINAMPEHERFLRGLTSWVGFKQTEVEFERKARKAGETKYTLKKMLKYAGNGIVSYSTWPLTLAMKSGLLFGFLSVACFITFIVLACCKIFLPLTAWLFPTVALFFSWMLIITGFNNIYLRRTYEETRNRPRYIISETKNFEKN